MSTTSDPKATDASKPNSDESDERENGTAEAFDGNDSSSRLAYLRGEMGFAPHQNDNSRSAGKKQQTQRNRKPGLKGLSGERPKGAPPHRSASSASDNSGAANDENKDSGDGQQVSFDGNDSSSRLAQIRGELGFVTSKGGVSVGVRSVGPSSTASAGRSNVDHKIQAKAARKDLGCEQSSQATAAAPSRVATTPDERLRDKLATEASSRSTATSSVNHEGSQGSALSSPRIVMTPDDRLRDKLATEASSRPTRSSADREGVQGSALSSPRIVTTPDERLRDKLATEASSRSTRSSADREGVQGSALTAEPRVVTTPDERLRDKLVTEASFGSTRSSAEREGIQGSALAAAPRVVTTPDERLRDKLSTNHQSQATGTQDSYNSDAQNHSQGEAAALHCAAQTPDESLRNKLMAENSGPSDKSFVSCGSIDVEASALAAAVETSLPGAHAEMSWFSLQSKEEAGVGAVAVPGPDAAEYENGGALQSRFVDIDGEAYDHPITPSSGEAVEEHSDPKEEDPIGKNKQEGTMKMLKYRFMICGAILLAVVVVAVCVPLLVAKGGTVTTSALTESLTSAPTASPTSAPTASPISTPTASPTTTPTASPRPTSGRVLEYDSIMTKLVQETGTPQLQFEGDTPQSEALNWIVYGDPVLLGADSPNLVQRYALMVIYYGSGGPTTALDWESETGNECTWAGVGCEYDTYSSEDGGYVNSTGADNEGGMVVTDLQLKESFLAGTLVPEVGLLQDLQALILNDNRFGGSLPSTIGSLVNLRMLSLCGNHFSGPLFEHMLHMPLLEEVDSAFNYFSGTISSTIGALSRLRLLRIERNGFTGTLPSQLGEVTALEEFNIRDNIFAGSIPSEMGNLTNMTFVNMGECDLEGSIPTELGRWEMCKHLDMSKQAGFVFDRAISGNIPTELGNMRSLEFLNIHSNNLEGLIPTELGKCQLETLYLQQNDLKGSVGEEICALREIPPFFLEDFRVDCRTEVICPKGCCTMCQ